MSGLLVIFEELLLQNPVVKEIADRLQVELLPVSDGRAAVEQSIEKKPLAILLDPAMPKMSGLEVCRRLKEELGETAAVVLISSVSSPSLQVRAAEVGCDLFLEANQIQDRLFDFLASRNSASPPPAVGGTPLRVEAPDPIQIEVGGKPCSGRLMNISTNGVLFAISGELAIGSPVVARFSLNSGDVFVVSCIVIRTIRLKTPIEQFSFAAGAKFAPLEPALQAKLVAFIAERKAEEKSRLPVSSGFARQVMEAAPDYVASAVLGMDPSAPIGPFLGKVLPKEQEAFQKSDDQALCIQRVVLLRAQCAVFVAYLPELVREQSSVGPIFLKLLMELLKKADQIEEEIDIHVRKAVADDAEELRQALNQISSNLHESKMGLLFSADQGLSMEGWGNLESDRKALRDRADRVRGLRRGEADTVKYDRKVPKLEGKIEDFEKKTTPLRVGKKVWIFSMALAVLVSAGFVTKLFRARVPADHLKLPLAYEFAKQDDEGMTVQTTRRAWDVLTADERKITLDGLEDYVRNKRIRQVKLLDEHQRVIAGIAATGSGIKGEYRRKIF